MKSILAVTLALVALVVAPAGAADLPFKAPPMSPVGVNWSGFYVGAHFGHLWGRTTFIDDGVVTETDAATDGVVAGLLGGYNWQTGPLVLGVEGDFGWSHARGTGGLNPPVTDESRFYRFNWTSHVRGRAGYSAGPWLFFVAGGLALTDFSVRMDEISSPSMTCGSVFVGYSVGGGVDYAFTNNFSGRLEFLYDDYGSKTYVMPPETYEVRITGSTLRAAINLKLSPR